MKKREINIDILRSLCIIAVLFIHTTASYMVNDYPSMSSKIILFIGILTSCAVPLFYMLSGAFLINEKNESIKTVWKKVIKMLLQVVMWTLIYQLVFKFILKSEVNIAEVMIKSFTSSQVGHLWFMYPLIGIYILLPFISKLYLSLSTKEKRILVLLVCVIPTIIQTIKIKYDSLFAMPYFGIGFPEIGMFILGKYLYENKENYINKKHLLLSLLLIVVSFVLIVIMAYYFINMNGISNSKPYYDYNKLPNLLMLISVFILFLNFEVINKLVPHKIGNCISWIGKNTLGIYFIHMIFIYIFPTIKIGNLYFTSNSGDIKNMLLGMILYFILSVISVYILKKIPLIRKLVD